MIGELFGNYRATALLGEGGMGAVYLAEHPAIGRRVAVKVLHPNYAPDQQLLARFLNEARAANAIRHPNIIEILDSGVLASGTPFLVMELLEGESLGTRLRRVGMLPVAAALELAHQTASALGAAHAKGIVHRDLKPDNLFVIPDPHHPESERIKVLDFGIAKLQQSPLDSIKTRTGTLMGTPIYMSPEQCRGTKALDHRTDVYSLGVIIYEMLAGHPPFVSQGFGELVHMHLNVQPAPLRPERPEIPALLETVVLRALAKDPEERFADMGELQAALKSSGGFQVPTVPDLAGRRTLTAKVASRPVSRPHDTTFTTGTGERMNVPPPPPRTERGVGGKAALAFGLLALAGAGYFVLAGRKGQPAVSVVASDPGKSTVTSGPVVTAPPPRPVESAAPGKPPATKLPAGPVTLRISSQPAGATVVDGAGQSLGVTPLVLTRPRGSALDLRVRKEGYAASARTVSLTADQTVELTLEREKPMERARPKHAVHKTHQAPESEEPAKL